MKVPTVYLAAPVPSIQNQCEYEHTNLQLPNTNLARMKLDAVAII